MAIGRTWILDAHGAGIFAKKVALNDNVAEEDAVIDGVVSKVDRLRSSKSSC